MLKNRDWRADRRAWIEILTKKTGAGLTEWNRRIQARGFRDEQLLRNWLSSQHIEGFAQRLLVMECFGYPDYMLSATNDLIAKQYADRPGLRAILDKIVEEAARCGSVVIQARKTYVSLVSPRRTFARVQPTTKTRVDLGLRLDGQAPAGRVRSNSHDTMRPRIELTAAHEVDSEVVKWLRHAYTANS
jgi:hypothetical protein